MCCEFIILYLQKNISKNAYIIACIILNHVFMQKLFSQTSYLLQKDVFTKQFSQSLNEDFLQLAASHIMDAINGHGKFGEARAIFKPKLVQRCGLNVYYMLVTTNNSLHEVSNTSNWHNFLVVTSSPMGWVTCICLSSLFFKFLRSTLFSPVLA